MRVLVTGAAGFLGAALVEALCRSEFDVRAMVHRASVSSSFAPEVELVVADIADVRKVKEVTVGCNAVVHLAAKVHAIDAPAVEQDYQAINVEGTKHILDAAVASGTNRVVFASSVKVFGEETAGCIDESQTPDPQTAYGRSKWRAEQLVADYTERHSLTAVSLRLPMVYGPTEKGNLYRMIEAIDHGRFPVLPRLSMVRSLLHVDNFIQAVLLCLSAPRFQRAAYIVADTHPYCVTDLYNWLRAGLGKAPPQWRVPLWVLQGGAKCGDVLQTLTGRPGLFTTQQLEKLIGCAWYSSKAMTRDLGYQALHSFESAVPALITFYRGAKRTHS